MTNWRSVGAEPYAPTKMKAIIGGGREGRHLWPRLVCPEAGKKKCAKKKTRSKRWSISNQQQGARQVRSNTKLFVSYAPMRPLALDRQTTTATESGTTTKHAIHTHFSKESSRGKRTPNNAIRGRMYATTGFFRGYCLLITTFAWRRLTAEGTCIIQPSRPRGRSHSQCCCVAFPGAVIAITTTFSSFSHACACHVYIHVCLYVYLSQFNKQMHYYSNYDPYRSTMGIFLQ